MMKDINSTSEKYRKYLLEVLFEEQMYYTVWGSDLSNNDTDKLLIDADNNILAFQTPAALLTAILKANSFFDNEMLSKWAKEAFGIEKPYATINFDGLSIKNIDLSNVDLFRQVNDTLGVVTDYAIQVNEESLLKLLESDALKQFKDDLSDYYIWSESETLKTSVDADDLILSLNSIYTVLKKRLTIRQII